MAGGDKVVLRGGDKLREKLAEISQNVARAASLKVGFLEGATYPDGTPVAMIAAIQDFGAPRAGIPPRPFFRNMIAEKSPEWGPALAALLPENNYDAQAVLEQAGAAIEGQLKESIISTTTPPLKPATIKRKGFATPLIDTGHMLNSTGYVVTAKGE